MAKPKKGVNPFALPAKAAKPAEKLPAKDAPVAEHASALRAEVAKNPIGVKKDAVAKAIANGDIAKIRALHEQTKAKNTAFTRHKKGK